MGKGFTIVRTRFASRYDKFYRSLAEPCNGFTIVELIVVMAVMVVMSVVIALIFSNTLRGSAKSQVLSAIKQNGQIALEGMDKTIRNADKAVTTCPSTDPKTGLVTFRNGQYSRFVFVAPTQGANGYIFQETVSGGQNCSDPPPNSPETLTNRDPKSGVSIVGGRFIINRSPGFGDIVTIEFMVKPAVDVAPFFSNQIDPVPFQTTIVVRNQ